MSSPIAETVRGADFRRQEVVVVNSEGTARSGLEPLFAEAVAADFRLRWDEVQRGFVDDPERAVKAGDELVTQVIQSLAESLNAPDRQFDGDGDADNGDSTENLRISLRRYRALFERLLAA
jgi:hypothetical protein